MIRRPPRSTPFPTRRSSDLGHRPAHVRLGGGRADEELGGDLLVAAPRGHQRHHLPRSEEHTSELQSHSDLVCRLLLEKKKKIKNTFQNKENQMLDQHNTCAI